MKVVFMGTPVFAVTSLKALIESKHNVVTVITQTDKPKGRKGKLCAPPIKNLALESGIETIQPEDVNDKAVVNKLRDINPDILVVVAFGQKISREILNLPRYKCINIHASLLPKYRGAAPINRVIINGEDVTGITCIILREKMDAGEIIMQKPLKIYLGETAGEVGDRLSELGAEVLMDCLDLIETGVAKYAPQDENLATYAPKLKKRDGLINWNQSAKDIHNFVRGMHPWPAAYTNLVRGTTRERIIVLKTEKEKASGMVKDKVPGTIIEISEKGLKIATRKNDEFYIWIKELKPEGKQSMAAYSYSRGNDIRVGYIFQ